MEIIDYLLARKKAGGGSDVTIEQLSVTENGTYSEEGIAYSPVVVNVPAPANSYQLKDVPSGTISTIDDGTALPMPSLKVGIEPVQSGSGDPSPENIRPISGWTAANVTRCGKNLFDTSTLESITYNDQGQKRWGKIFVKSGTYSISTEDNQDGTGFIFAKVVASDGTFGDPITVRGQASLNNITLTVASGEKLLIYTNLVKEQTAQTYFSTNVKLMLESGTNFSTYEPYNGQTYTIEFKDGDNPITVYGGTLDVTSGELVVDRKLVDMGNLSWAYDASYNRFASNAISGTEPPDGARIVSFIASIYEVVSDGRPISQVASGQMYSSFDYTQTNAVVMVHDNRFTDATLFKNAVTGQTFIYKLATPITYHLTPTQVRTLVGNNNIWADTGDIIEGKYFKSLS